MFLSKFIRILKSAEPSTSTRPNVDRMETLPKKALEILLLDKNRSLQVEPVAMKAPQIDSESKYN